MASGRSRNSSIEPDVDSAMDMEGWNEGTPYIRLWAIVLTTGIRDYCAALDKCYAHEHPWITWLRSDLNSPGSYVWICELLDICPDKTRAHINGRWKEIASTGQGKKRNKQDQI